MQTLDEYLDEYGYTQADLTPEELQQAKEELAVINEGGRILDGVCCQKMMHQYE